MKHQYAALLILGVFALSINACNVPVFRYALERWRPDMYDAVLFHDGRLSAQDSALVRQLADAAAPPQSANLRVSLANVKDSLPDWVRAVWAGQRDQKFPRLVLCQSDKYRHKAIWSGPLTAQVIGQIVHSPARLEASRRILQGESAVWIMVQSGNRAKDKAVSDTLVRIFKAMNDSLALPKADDNTATHILVSQKIPLQIKFSALYLSPGDPAEQVFLRMLLDGKADPSAMTGPAVCLLFGRGRNLDVLTAERITSKSLRKMSQFITGICACSIKEANPGTDMLMNVDWDAALAGSLTPEPMPSLTGMTTMGDTVPEVDAAKVSTPKDAGARKKAPAKPIK